MHFSRGVSRMSLMIGSVSGLNRTRSGVTWISSARATRNNPVHSPHTAAEPMLAAVPRNRRRLRLGDIERLFQPERWHVEGDEQAETMRGPDGITRIGERDCGLFGLL